MIVAIAAIFIAGLSIPGAWKEQHEALVLACAISVVRVTHLVTYWLAAADDKVVQRQILGMAVAVCISAVMLVVGAFLGGPAQTLVWFSALVVDYAGVYFGGSNWRLPSAAHFAERHGLIVIVALGESFVAVGVGASEASTTAPVILAALLGMLISLSLWWTYFDVTALYAERVLAAKQGIERVRMARDSYSYLHFPMIAGIIFLAVGLKEGAVIRRERRHACTFGRDALFAVRRDLHFPAGDCCVPLPQCPKPECPPRRGSCRVSCDDPGSCPNPSSWRSCTCSSGSRRPHFVRSDSLRLDKSRVAQQSVRSDPAVFY